MPRPYSQDLRERVVAYVEAGHSRRGAAAHFDVSPSFVINLMTAYQARGNLAPKPLGGRRHAKLDPHRVFLLTRVAEKDDITMPELAGELEAECGTRADPALAQLKSHKPLRAASATAGNLEAAARTTEPQAACRDDPARESGRKVAKTLSMNSRLQVFRQPVLR
jgi:transposase